MTYTFLGGNAHPTKSRVFISYHHRGDQAYYNSFSKTFHDTYDAVYDNSLDRQIDSDNVEYVMRRIREEYLTGTSCTLVLVGPHTWGRKFVDWEIKATLDKKHALVGVYLPTAPRTSENKIRVPDRLHDNIQSGFASWVSWQEITSSADQLLRVITDARSRSPALIQNSSELRLRNA